MMLNETDVLSRLVTATSALGAIGASIGSSSGSCCGVSLHDVAANERTDAKPNIIKNLLIIIVIVCFSINFRKEANLQNNSYFSAILKI